ncbi:hypothetical protein MVES1_003642 [Malassezia vespertilionis]|uniref:Uncharacterized protein n=1 Tax=Malassezia vespertilionis TaxID=2020962 RepID=A0A2N1J8U7_9BASI|nr:uncharacterized protein MVES1_003642 [Malassezia vespertilionis]PKI82892.1 hypothetical protein MVES_003211 [Malassezia vespertilionis]WFD08270.1 hypothetical protein MVES1_003642 [Malassezia vespertilionis]
MPPKREPIQSALAPRPRGILKNKQPVAENASGSSQLHWDEGNLDVNQYERDNTAARMKIDEPKTPFVHSTSAPPLEEEGFDLDMDPDARPRTASVVRDDDLLDREQVAANTKANAQQSASVPLVAPHAVAPAPSFTEKGTQQLHHAEFQEKRHHHYGDEAQALKMAAQLPEEEDE